MSNKKFIRPKTGIEYSAELFEFVPDKEWPIDFESHVVIIGYDPLYKDIHINFKSKFLDIKGDKGGPSFNEILDDLMSRIRKLQERVKKDEDE